MWEISTKWQDKETQTKFIVLEISFTISNRGVLFGNQFVFDNNWVNFFPFSVKIFLGFYMIFPNSSKVYQIISIYSPKIFELMFHNFFKVYRGDQVLTVRHRRY